DDRGFGEEGAAAALDPDDAWRPAGDGAADAQDAASDEEDPWGPNADLPDEDEDAAPSDDDEAAAALGDWNVDDDEDTGRDQVPAPSKHVPARPARSAARPATDASEDLA